MNAILPHRRCDLAAVALAVALGAAAGSAHAMGAGGGPARAATNDAAPTSERDAPTGPAICDKGRLPGVANRKCVVKGGGAALNGELGE